MILHSVILELILKNQKCHFDFASHLNKYSLWTIMNLYSSHILWISQVN